MDTVATRHKLQIFVVNRSTEPITLDIDLRALPAMRPDGQISLADNDPRKINSADAPERVTPTRDTGGTTVPNAARGVILPLDDLAKSLNLAEADFSPPVWQAGTYNNQRYAIPLDVHRWGCSTTRR